MITAVSVTPFSAVGLWLCCWTF